MTVLEIVADVATRLDAMSVPYAIGGSLASGVWGEWRNTNDADIVVQLSRQDMEKFRDGFGDPYYVSLSDLSEALESRKPFASAQILHMDEAFKIDLFILPENEYSAETLRRAVPVNVLDGVQLRFASAEDMVVTKLRWFELGNRVSERQWNDIVRMLDVQLPKLDLDYCRKWSEFFGVASLLIEAVGQAKSPQ